MLGGLRKEVRTRKEENGAVRNLAILFLFSIVFLLPIVEQRLELLEDSSAWVVPDFDVRLQDGSVFVDYRAVAEKAVKASFKVQTRSISDEVTCTYSSAYIYTYSPNLKVRKPWKWDAWAEVGSLGSCSAPEPPSRVCLRYTGYSVRHKTPFDTPWECRDFLAD